MKVTLSRKERNGLAEQEGLSSVVIGGGGGMGYPGNVHKVSIIVVEKRKTESDCRCCCFKFHNRSLLPEYSTSRQIRQSMMTAMVTLLSNSPIAEPTYV